MHVCSMKATIMAVASTGGMSPKPGQDASISGTVWRRSTRMRSLCRRPMKSVGDWPVVTDTRVPPDATNIVDHISANANPVST